MEITSVNKGRFIIKGSPVPYLISMTLFFSGENLEEVCVMRSAIGYASRPRMRILFAIRRGDDDGVVGDEK